MAELRAGREDAIALTRGAPGGPDRERRWDPLATRAAAGVGAAASPFADAAAVVHLAGATIGVRWTERRRAEIRASRVDATRALVAELARLPRPPRVLVSASAVGYYGDRGDEELAEDSAPGSGFLAGLAVEWEAEARRAEALGVRVVLLRMGIVLGRGGGVLSRLVPLFRLGLGGAPGNGRQWWSWIALDDLVALIRRALTDEALRGPVNAVSPAPARAGDFARALGRALHRPALAPAPAAMLRLAFGAMADEVLLASQRVRPGRLLELGFDFRHGALDGALRAACES